MREISKLEYETLLDRGLRYIGKVMPYDTMTPEIYFTISPEEKELGARGIVEKISNNHDNFYGQFDFACYWTPVLTSTIVYPQQNPNE